LCLQVEKASKLGSWWSDCTLSMCRCRWMWARHSSLCECRMCQHHWQLYLWTLFSRIPFPWCNHLQ